MVVGCAQIWAPWTASYGTGIGVSSSAIYVPPPPIKNECGLGVSTTGGVWGARGARLVTGGRGAGWRWGRRGRETDRHGNGFCYILPPSLYGGLKVSLRHAEPHVSS